MSKHDGCPLPESEHDGWCIWCENAEQRAENAEHRERWLDAQQQNNVLSTVLAETKAALEATESNVTRLEADIERWLGELEASRAETAAATARVAELEARCQGIADMHSAAELERDALRSHVRDLDRDGCKSTAPLVHFMCKAEATEIALRDLRERVEALLPPEGQQYVLSTDRIKAALRG